MRINTKQARKRGVAIVEFSFLMLVLVPLLLGTVGVGLNMIRSLETVQLARDAGHMYARGTDFSLPGNKTILLTLGNSIGLTSNSSASDAAVILSSVVYIDKAMCAADSKVDASGNPLGCTNYQKWSFTQRLTIGDTTMRTSTFAHPL